MRPRSSRGSGVNVAAEWMMRGKNIDHPSWVWKLKCIQPHGVSPIAHDPNGLCVNGELSKYRSSVSVQPSSRHNNPKKDLKRLAHTGS